MVILIGNNLGERHRELNAIVAEAADKKIDFEEVKSQEEKSDIDKLYKIDLASRYRNIDYILDVLKCGDVFYITRALKCQWLYNNEYSDYINSNYVTNNIFPHMSTKMQKKTLTQISTYLRESERAIDFYTYCRDSKLRDYSYKFLVLTPETFKLNVMYSEGDFVSRAGPKFLTKFIANSLKLALAYINFQNCSRHAMYLIRYIYFVSDVWYLDILENYELKNDDNPNSLSRLGLRVSKDILIKHKKRVIKYPQLYIYKLNMNMLLKYLTKEDVKSLAFALLPKTACLFWSLNFYHTYKFILDKIPTSDLFNFIKKIFNAKFSDEEFEFAIEFYHLKYYEMLSIEERETWALEHIKRDKQLEGIENYIWYKFVSFEKAFKGIKRYISITLDASKRSQIVNILPESARNQEDLSKMLDYYYQRHINESEEYKESFINKVIEHHDLYSLDIECWAPLDKLFCSLDVYTSFNRLEHIFRLLIYHILYNKVLPKTFEEYITFNNFYNACTIIDELSEERNYVVTKFLMNFCAEKIKSLIEKPRDVNIQDDNDFVISTTDDEIRGYVNKVWNIIYCFKRDHNECPEIVLQHMTSNIDNYQHHQYFKPKFIPKTEGDFIRCLKQGIQTAIDCICEIRCNTYRWEFKLCRLFRKLKVYFPNDIREKYLKYFVDYLSDVPKGRREYRNIKMAVVGIFYLADEDFKVTFMDKNVPVTPKIDYGNIDNRLLQVQKAICRLAYHSRPFLPLVSVKKYITGDYIHYFLPVLYNYQANLPSISKFVEILLDAPLSIQKHGLRLAFKCYDRKTLKPIIINAWQKTKNVSLRKLLYVTLFDRIINESKDGQKELYDVLKLYTSELNHDDHDDIYLRLVSGYLPNQFKGDFIEIAWHTVNKLSDKSVDKRRKLSIICHMEKNIELVQREFLRMQIIDDHIHQMFHMKEIKMVYYPCFLDDIVEAKWNLTAKYIVSFNNKEEQQQSVHLMNYIVNNTITQWDYIYSDTYVLRKFIRNFISNIMDKEPKISKRCALMVPIYKCILDTFTEKLKEEDIYLITWELKLSIACRKIIYKSFMAEAKQSYRMSSKEIINCIGKRFGYMINNLVEKNKFQYSFYQSIADIVINVGKTICDFLSVKYSYFDYYISESLIDIKIIETHVLALLILPTDPPFNLREEHLTVIKKIKQFDNKVIQNFFHQKYVQSDYCVRFVDGELETAICLTDSD